MNMKKVNALKLIGAALEFAVASIEAGKHDKAGISEGVAGMYSTGIGFNATPYTTDWNLGGPIFERVITEYHREVDGRFWVASDTHGAGGSTLLEAAMRCHVLTSLGLERDMLIEVPESVAHLVEA